MAKFSSIMISIIVAGTIVTLLLLAMTDIADKNGLDFDNATLAEYNRTNEAIELSKQMRNNESQIQSSNLLDLLGDLFQSGYFVARMSKNSFNSLEYMGNRAGDDLNIGQAGTIFFSALVGILSVVVIFGLISMLINRDA